MNLKTSQELLKEKIKEGKLIYKPPSYFYISYMIFAVLWFLPTILNILNYKTFSLQPLTTPISFPSLIIALATAVFIAALALNLWRRQYNIKKGGLKDKHNTYILITEGPYKVLRHPSDFSWSLFSITLPIVLSKVIIFTPLCIIGIGLTIVMNYYASLQEEKLNIKKWASSIGNT
jgi:protein-S-isoprenylcysteine O-methyltransferase Ste14